MKDLDRGVDRQFADKLGKIIVWFGKIYNGFEVHGMHHIPLDRPALLVFYHGLIPIDAWYFGLHFYLEKKVLIRALGDRWLFRTPGLSWICRAVGAIPGDPKIAAALLKNGALVGVSPGGVREAIKGMSNNYKLVWGDRMGFAKVATEAQVDVIPVFTENIDETYIAPYAEHPIFQSLYHMTRLPLVPILSLFGLPFPVKLRTWVGEPIRFDPDRSVEELRDLTAQALNELIEKHQTKDQTVVDALKKRLGL
ncbi:MAG: lysophospholipid acyltransferase family protein [Bdellovibrionales bacterium]